MRIHQPNLFPRLSTLAKFYAADIWIVFDDVQFNHRDYQHRARLASLDDEQHQHWLSLPVHRPFGRSTRINEVLLLEPDKSAPRVRQLVHQYYGRVQPRLVEVYDVRQELVKVGQQLHARLTSRAARDRPLWVGIGESFTANSLFVVLPRAPGIRVSDVLLMG